METEVAASPHKPRAGAAHRFHPVSPRLPRTPGNAPSPVYTRAGSRRNLRPGDRCATSRSHQVKAVRALISTHSRLLWGWRGGHALR